MNKAAFDDDEELTREDAARYLHDIAGQLSEMARRFGLEKTADALANAQHAVQSEL